MASLGREDRKNSDRIFNEGAELISQKHKTLEIDGKQKIKSH